MMSSKKTKASSNASQHWKRLLIKHSRFTAFSVVRLAITGELCSGPQPRLNRIVLLRGNQMRGQSGAASPQNRHSLVLVGANHGAEGAGTSPHRWMRLGHDHFNRS